MIVKQQSYNAAGYCRLSSEDDLSGESSSIATQRELITQYCKEHGVNLFDCYVDDGFSGTNFQRPNFERMLGDIDSGRVNLVITKDLSRFGRDYIQSGYYIERVFARKNVRYVAVDDGIDTLQNSNDILMPIKNVLNDMYARDISRKTRAAFNAKAKSGQFIASRAPFGYRKSPEDKHKLIVDEPAAEVVRKIFDLAVQGYGYNRIAKALRAENILNPQAWFNQKNPDFYQSDYWKQPFDWHTTSVRALLNNMAYLGHIVFGKERITTINAKNGTKMPEDEWIIVRDTHEAIISQEQWDAAHEMLRSRKRESSNGEVQMFAGLLYCPDCGSALSYHGRKANNGEYSCLKYKTHGKAHCSSHYIRYDALYQIVLTEIRRQARQAAHCEAQFRKRLQEIDGEKSKAQMAKARRQLEANEARAGNLDRIMSSLYEDKALGRLTQERFDSMTGKYEAEQKALLEQVNALREGIARAEEQRDNTARFVEYIRQYTDLQALNAPILNQLIQRIEVYDAEKEPGTGKQAEGLHPIQIVGIFGVITI